MRDLLGPDSQRGLEVTAWVSATCLLDVTGSVHSESRAD